MIEILKETTVWNADFPVCNHTYLLDGDKLIAYIKDGDITNTPIISKSKMRISKRYRTFIKVNNPALSKLIPTKAKDNNIRIFKVKSKDKEYMVEYNGKSLSCTCTGYSFRGKCKHIAAVAEKQQLVI